MAEPMTISFVADEKIKQLLDKWAAEEDRSISSLIRRLIESERERRQNLNSPRPLDLPPGDLPEAA